ncbi:hypothetical protein R1sor_020978 [Riccia sorocarpa]|uniref:Uncharacterized protein n=1 Tax=Riccia sorocarpa TaxID=122646 RepID=A0ABD3GIM3_9MARC
MEESGFRYQPSLYLTPQSSVETIEESNGSSRAEKYGHWLQSVEDILRGVVGPEARVWLCSAIAALSIPSDVQSSVFMSFLKDAAFPSLSRAKRQGAEDLLTFSRKRDKVKETHDSREILLKQFVGMLCDGNARQVGRLLAKDDKLLRRFFSGDANRILGWFGNFAGAGETDHRLGARALARYAFLHREDYWHELEWKGKHSQAPATVASKPHYFSELDVVKTINNFLEHVPSFWYSEELKDSLEECGFLGLDPDFFHCELLERLTREDCDELWLLIEDYLRTESFSTLCQRTLYLMSDKLLLDLLSDLGAALRKSRKNVIRGREQGVSREAQEDFKDISWVEVTFLGGVEWNNFSDAAFSHACASHGREILRLLKDEDHEEEGKALRSLLSQGLLCESEHWRLMHECLKAEKWEAVKWLSIEAWLLFYLMCQDGTSAGSLERLMTESGIGFLRLESTSPQGSDHVNPSRERKRKEKRKRLRERRRAKKRAHHDEDEESDSGTDLANEAENSRSVLNWRLSLDKYTIIWTKVDVAEHLVSYALRRWLYWVTVRW